MGADAATAQLKVLASLPPDAGASAQRVAARFHLDPTNWYSRDETPPLLPALAGAVWSEKRIRIRYESWKDIVTRVLDPLGLVLKGGIWYLVAAAKGQPRTYRVSNVHSLDVLEASARRPPRFDLARYWKAWAKDFEARLLRERATVKLSPEGLRLLREHAPAAGAAALESNTPCAPAGWISAEIPIEGIAHAARHLLRLGADIEVVSPPGLREALAQEAKNVARLYARRR
jgi:predicted DNA-binding transcriptional regulator YafY